MTASLILLLSLLSIHHNCCLYFEWKTKVILGSLLIRNLDWTHFAILSITEEEFTILFRTQTDSLVESRIIQMSSRLCDPSWYLVESFCLAPKAAPGASCPGDRPRVSRLQWMSRNQGTECIRGWATAAAERRHLLARSLRFCLRTFLSLLLGTNDNQFLASCFGFKADDSLFCAFSRYWNSLGESLGCGSRHR